MIVFAYLWVTLFVFQMGMMLQPIAQNVVALLPPADEDAL